MSTPKGEAVVAAIGKLLDHHPETAVTMLVTLPVPKLHDRALTLVNACAVLSGALVRLGGPQPGDDPEDDPEDDGWAIMRAIGGDSEPVDQVHCHVEGPAQQCLEFLYRVLAISGGGLLEP